MGLRGPYYAHWGVTHRCNLRCRMCTIWKEAASHRELVGEAVGTLAKNLNRWKVSSVALGGGEPFVRDDIADIVSIFSDCGMELRLLTNGYGVSDDQVRGVVEAGLNHVSISLDSLDREKQKEIHAGLEIWDEVVDTMKRFSSRLGSGSVPIMNVVVSRQNLLELPELVEFAENIGFFCSFVPISLATGPEDDLSPERQDWFRPGSSEHEDLEQIFAKLVAMKRSGAPIANSSMFLKNSLEYLKTGRIPWRCDAGRHYISIDPSGGISICHKFPPFTSYSDADPASTAGSLSNEIREQRSTCSGCMRPCWAETSHALTNPSAILEAAKTFARGRRS